MPTILHGHGKQSFREFTKTVNETKRMIIRALKSGERYTLDQINEWYAQILEDYDNRLQEERIDFDWYTRAVTKVEDTVDSLRRDYPIIEEEPDEPEPEDEDKDNEGEIAGFPIISEDECLAGNDARPRNQILTSLEELREYLEPIPPEIVKGIILHYRNGEFRGFIPCLRKDTL